MITRHKIEVKDILHSQLLTLYPPENQAAKIFVEWLKEHPEYSVKDVDMRIDSYERQEDYYGNGGGCTEYVRIFKRREETQEECDARIIEEEKKCLDKFRVTLRKNIGELIQDFNIYPNLVSDDITNHINMLEEDIMAIVSTKIHNVSNHEQNDSRQACS